VIRKTDTRIFSSDCSQAGGGNRAGQLSGLRRAMEAVQSTCFTIRRTPNQAELRSNLDDLFQRSRVLGRAPIARALAARSADWNRKSAIFSHLSY
jgi:hypothetical protein